MRERSGGWCLGAAGRLCSLLFLALLLFLRRPESLLHPQFWAEDGAIFFRDACEEGFAHTLVKPYAGYLHIVPRAVAGFALLFPMAWAPLLYNLSAFLLQMTPVAYLLSARAGALLPSCFARTAAALLLVVLPNSAETYVNLTNAAWHLLITALLALMVAPPKTCASAITDVTLVALAALSTPLAALLAPVAVWSIITRTRERNGGVAVPVTLLAGAAIQGVFVLSGGRLSAVRHGGGGILDAVVPFLAENAFFAPLLGVWGSKLVHAHLTLPWHLAGLALLALIFFFALRERPLLLGALVYLAAAIVVLAVWYPTVPVSVFTSPPYGLRYFGLPTLAVLCAALSLAFSRARARPLGVAALVPAVALAIPGDFRHPPLPDTHFHDQIAAFRSLPPGESYPVPLNPLWWDVPLFVVRRDGSPSAPSPLSTLVEVPPSRDLAAGIAPARTVCRDTSCTARDAVILGWVLDEGRAGPPRGVYLQARERLFPAVMGGVPEVVDGVALDPPPGKSVVFYRRVPLEGISPGGEGLSLVILHDDGRSYSRVPIAFAGGE